MNEQTGLAQGPILGFVGIAIVGIVAGGLYYSGVLSPSPPPASDTTAIAQTPAEPAPELATEPEQAAPPKAVETTEPAETTPVAETPIPPSIDTFRLDADGRMLVAGRTRPDWETAILLDDDQVGLAAPDASGQFVEFIDINSSEHPRILSLSMRPANGGEAIASVEQIIIAPTPRPTPEVVADAAEPETPLPEETAKAESEQTATAADLDSATDPTDDPPTNDAPEATAQSDPPEVEQVQAQTQSQAQTKTQDQALTQDQTQTVLLADDTGVRVLQAPTSKDAGPNDKAPEVTSSVALDAITYSEHGEVQLSGRAQGDGFVRLYLNNAPVTSTPITQDGNWRSDLPEVDTGVYTLRIDEVDTEGNVTSRVETPFKREAEAVLAEVDTKDAKVAVVTVQPGSTLWAISREAYGEGILYVRVFEANSDRIRDPDLIYPGQVFTIPE